MTTLTCKKTQLIEWLDKHLDDCPVIGMRV